MTDCKKHDCWHGTTAKDNRRQRHTSWCYNQRDQEFMIDVCVEVAVDIAAL